MADPRYTPRYTPRINPPVRSLRIPYFHPVPLRKRKGGWTARNQAFFIGYLAQTRNVAAAARLVGMSRETAYRLRARPGAEEFAAVWAAIMAGETLTAPDLADVTRTARRVTPWLMGEHAIVGKIRPTMRRGKVTGMTVKADISALLSHLAQLDRAFRSGERFY